MFGSYFGTLAIILVSELLFFTLCRPKIRQKLYNKWEEREQQTDRQTDRQTERGGGGGDFHYVILGSFAEQT